MPRRCLLCGDPQQPSEYMYESAGFLEDHGVSFDRMDWRDELSPEEFREITMEMEERGPNDYDTESIADRLEGVEILVVHKAPVSEALLEAGDALEVVGCARGGTENIDLAAAEERGIVVIHAPGRNENAVADFAAGLILARIRDIPRFAASTGRGEWELEFDPKGLPRDIEELTIGIVGFGNIGSGVAERMRGFGPDLVVHDPYVADAAIRQQAAEPASLNGVLEQADVVTLHVRLSAETRHLIGPDEFDRMRGDAFLVNTARGGLVDEDALVEALDADAIGGAALDVFEEEPLPAGHPLVGRDDVILTPHTAGSTKDAVLNGSRLVAEDLARWLEGTDPEHVVTR